MRGFIFNSMSFNPERINIKDLTIEEPEKDWIPPFDPVREITAEDWELMKHILDVFRKTQQWGKFSHLATEMKVLDSKFNLNLDEEAWQGMRHMLDFARKQGDWDFFFKLAMEMKILDPTINIKITVEEYKKAKDELEGILKITDGHYFKRAVMHMRFMNPNIDINLGPKFWEDVKTMLHQDSVTNRWLDFSSLAVASRIIDPDVELNLDEEAWQGMKNQLVIFRREYKQSAHGIHEELGQMAMNMKILAAEKVKITNKGLEITMPGKKIVEDKHPPIPQVRNF